MFERFTEPVSDVLKLAQGEARSLGHSRVGTEHVLLGLVRARDGVAAAVLEDLDITTERVRHALPADIARPRATEGRLELTPRAKMTLELALRETLAFGDSYVGTAHVLLGLTRVSESRAARIMFDLGVDPQRAGHEVLRLRSAADGSWKGGVWNESVAAGSMPVATGSPGPRRATAVRAVVEVALWAAASNAREQDRDVDLGDLLVALAEGWPEDLVAQVLVQAGIDPSRLREAVETARRRGQ
jgi:ATP-dependent Clp protease ATP-binding subunit ClpA